MDFRLPQEHGATFMYVLPTSAKEALIEYTLFSKRVLDKEHYKVALKNYITEDPKIMDYEIVHKEFGITPMSLANFSGSPNIDKKIINIRTAGGYTKASSGYTFQFIQKNTRDIVNNLRNGNFPNPKTTIRDKVFQWYDRTLLEVLISGEMTGKEIVSIMSRKLSPEKILAFLGNESSFKDDIKIINSLPKNTFSASGV